eukprot:m.320824 g.320824  ORF g.320824 m.320824 type:complete len:248 (-) comp24588_c0_seq1:120-863(-)
MGDEYEVLVGVNLPPEAAAAASATNVAPAQDMYMGFAPAPARPPERKSPEKPPTQGVYAEVKPVAKPAGRTASVGAPPPLPSARASEGSVDGAASLRASRTPSGNDLDTATAQMRRMSTGVTMGVAPAVAEAHRGSSATILAVPLADFRSAPWYHGRISRKEAEERLQKHGLGSGLFLLRDSSRDNSFALSLCFSGKIYHNTIEPEGSGYRYVAANKDFDSVEDLVFHYANRTSSKSFQLTNFCPRE